jgi:hypothetical protein
MTVGSAVFAGMAQLRVGRRQQCFGPRFSIRDPPVFAPPRPGHPPLRKAVGINRRHRSFRAPKSFSRRAYTLSSAWLFAVPFAVSFISASATVPAQIRRIRQPIGEFCELIADVKRDVGSEPAPPPVKAKSAKQKYHDENDQ